MAQPKLPTANPTQALEKDLNDFDRKLNELKTKYDQYFMGLEKLEPAKLRQEVSLLANKYPLVQIQNTGHKFRYQTLIAKFNTLTNMWNRNLREIEEGSHKRDLFKKKLHEQETQQVGAKPAAKTTKADTKGKANDPMVVLFEQYVEARKKTQESVQGLNRETLESQLKKQAAAIKEKFQCKRVTFKVVVEDGKAKIKAIPKNE